MTKRCWCWCCCCSSLFSCFSGDNSQSSSNSAQPSADNNAPAPALVREEAPDLRQQDPQTNLPASTVLDVSPSSNSAPTQSEQPLPHEAPASGDPSSSTSTVPQLTKKIEVHVADGAENDSINPEDIIQDISELLEIIKTKSSSKKPSTDHYWPSTSFFSKLKEILSEGADAALALKDIFPSEHSSEAMKMVKDLLKGIGQAHWAAAGLLVVANILQRFETVSANQDECLLLLEEMSNLAQHVKDLKQLRPALKKVMEDSIKKATEMVVEGALMCCSQINSSKFSRFFSTSVNKEKLVKFQEKLQKMYRRMDTQMLICILDTTECADVRPLKERERSYPHYAVGIEEQLEEVIELLEWESQKNAVAVMVHGIGGMGKTTLADAVFAQLYIEGCKYSMVRLFEDINATPNIIELQKRILKDLMLGSREEEQKSVIDNIHTFEDGQREIGRMLEKEVAFIYIDNVLGQDPLENLLPKDMEKAKRCRLLITARDKEVRKGCLMDNESVKFYDVKYLPDTEAMNLLKEELHYGKKDDREQLDSDQLQHIVKFCGGIPKLLNVLARYIRFEVGGQKKGFDLLMEDQKNWNVRIDGYIFTYDRLPESVKDPFLDICSFFNGYDWEEVTNIVGDSNMDVLEKRGLVNKDKDMKVTVHDVILTVGSKKSEGTRFTFKDAGEIKNTLEKDLQGIKGISLSEISHRFSISARKLDCMSGSLRILALGEHGEVEGTCKEIFEKLVYFQGEVSYLPFDVSQSKELRYFECKPQNLNFLKEMPSNLKHMELDGSLQSGDSFEISSSDFPQHQGLRTLRLFSFAGLKKLPDELGNLLKSLQELHLSSCHSIEEVPGSISKLQYLRKLILIECASLKSLPENLGSLSSLQTLDLTYCASLEEIPGSISKLRSLRELDMFNCSGLKMLPNDFGYLSSLQELDLSSCESIEELPRSITMLQSLRILGLSDCSSLKSLPEDFGSLSSLQTLNLLSCKSIEEIPGSISKLRSLRELDMFECSGLKMLPKDFGYLSSLQELDLSSCRSIEELPRSFTMLQSLRKLGLSDCSSLKSLPEDLGSLSSLQELYLSDCESIEELPLSIGKLQSLRELDMEGCSSLKRLPEDLGSLSSLQELDLSFLKSIEELPMSISTLQSLRELRLTHCSSLKSLPEDLGSLSSLQSLYLSDCKSIEELPLSFSKLPSLKWLKMNRCSNLKRLPKDFISLTPLEVEFEDCPNLDPPSMQVLLEMSRKDVTWHNVEVN